MDGVEAHAAILAAHFAPTDCDAFAAYDRPLARKGADLIARIADRWHVEIEGIERLPTNRALLVANHALAVALIERSTVEGALPELIEVELAKRAGFDVT